MRKWIATICVVVVLIQAISITVILIGMLVAAPRRPHDPAALLARLEQDAQSSGPQLRDTDVFGYLGKPNAVYANIHEQRAGVPKYYVSDFRGADAFRMYKVQGSTGIVAVEYLGTSQGVPEFISFVYQPDLYEVIRADIVRTIRTSE